MTIKEPWQFTEPACASVDVTIFFAKDKDEPEETVDLSDYQYAKKVCSTCPHKIECAEWGIQNETHGVWGGLTPRERQKIRRKRRILVSESIAI